MGIVRDAMAKIARVEAARARSEGRAIFVYRCNVPRASSRASGSVSGAAEVIEVIEGEGWSLSDMAYDGVMFRKGALILIFRHHG